MKDAGYLCIAGEVKSNHLSRSRQSVSIDPTGVAIDGKGNICVADNNSGRVFKLNDDLKVTKSAGGRECLQGITLSKDDTMLFVRDGVHHRIQVLHGH